MGLAACLRCQAPTTTKFCRMCGAAQPDPDPLPDARRQSEPAGTRAAPPEDNPIDRARQSQEARGPQDAGGTTTCVRCHAPVSTTFCRVCGVQQTNPQAGGDSLAKGAGTSNPGGATPAPEPVPTPLPLPVYPGPPPPLVMQPTLMPAPSPRPARAPAFTGPRRLRRGLFILGGASTFAAAAILVIVVFGGASVLPFGDSRKPSNAATSASLVSFDSALHFQVGANLSDISTTPSLDVLAKWRQPAKGICSESAVTSDGPSGGRTVARVSGTVSQLHFPATAGRTYSTTVDARRCGAPDQAVTTTATYSWKLHQETAATYSPGWHVGHCRCWSGRSVLASTGAGQTATFSASFHSFGLITDHGRNRGTADIFVDGVKVGSIDDYAPSAGTPMRVDLAHRAETGGPHVVLIKVTSGRIDIDAFLTSGT